jgi:hypothetical protein
MSCPVKTLIPLTLSSEVGMGGHYYLANFRGEIVNELNQEYIAALALAIQDDYLDTQDDYTLILAEYPEERERRAGRQATTEWCLQQTRHLRYADCIVSPHVSPCIMLATMGADVPTGLEYSFR